MAFYEGQSDGLASGFSGSGMQTADQQCQRLVTAETAFIIILYILGAGILVVLAFTKQRASLCRNCCDGRPGLKTPLNLLSNSHYRLVYAVIFGLMSNDFLSLAISGPNVCGSGFNVENAFCKTVLSPVVITFILCLSYAPLFACVDTHPYPLLGHALGLLYACILATYKGINLAYYLTCEPFGEDWLRWTEALSDLPIYAFYVVLLSWYSYQTLKDTSHLFKTNSAPQPPSGADHLKYVKHLLARRSPAERGRLMYWLVYIWPYSKGFRYPLKVLGPIVVMITIMFKLTYLTLLLAAIYDDSVRPYIESSATFNVTLDKNILGLLGGTLTISPFVSSGLCLLLIIHMARSIRMDLQQVTRDKLLSLSIKPVSHYWKLAASLKYCGYQIGYFIWAWLIYYVVSAVIGCLGILVYIGFKYFPEPTKTVVVTPVIILVWLFIVTAIQIIMCKYIFVDKREKSSKVLPVTNRNLFNWCAFFFFVYDSIVGFFGAILRVFLSMLFGILLLFRLDTNIMMRGFQFADIGHYSYKGFLHVEHTYNNPILNTFVVLLLGSLDKRQHSRQRSYGFEFGSIQQDAMHLLVPVKKYSSDGGHRRKYIRNRWLVAYTLLHNPCLRQLRASRLKEEVLAGDTENPFAMLT